MKNEIYYVIREYSMEVVGVHYPIKAKIFKRMIGTGMGDYYWSISHYCKPEKNSADVYIPSGIHGNAFEEAERHLLMYMEPFTNIDVTPNEFY